MNLRRRLLGCNADIKFDNICLKGNIVPNYAVIRVTGNSKASNNTKLKAQRIRIQNESKELKKKRQYLNKELYNIRLSNAKTWQGIWNMEKVVNDKVHTEREKKVKTRRR
jgi:dihydroxyacid dehydratase/phosphogluconate dehydratase